MIPFTALRQDSVRRLATRCLLAAICLLSFGVCAAFEFDWWPERWSQAERTTLSSMHVGRIEPAAAPAGIAPAHASDAIKLGKQLFFDPRLSGNGKISCASCHLPGKQFQDDRALGLGIDTGTRRTMPLAGSAGAAFFMWDGRKDSLWSQSLGPLEDAREHGGTRLAYAHVLHAHYRSDYERIFGPLPDLRRLPPTAGPAGTASERADWKALPASTQRQVSEVFANLGKSIAAYETTLRYGPSRLDHFIEGTLKNEAGARQLLTAQEKSGLRIFMNKGQCITCHNGPLLSDGHFHNTGIRPRDPARPDTGRAAGLAQLLEDEFSCLGPFSGMPPDKCEELRFLAVDDPRMLGAFKTPSLRNVAQRAPYMHAGQVQSVPDVIRHYAQAPAAAVGVTEIKPVRLSADEVRDLAAFLATLTGPILEDPAADGQGKRGSAGAPTAALR